MTVLASPQTAVVNITVPGAYITVSCAAGDVMQVDWVSPGSVTGTRVVRLPSIDVGPFVDDTVVTLRALSGSPQYTDVPGGGLNAAQTAVAQAMVSKVGIPTGIYLGAAFPKRLRRGSYGRKVASWSSALQNSVGTTSFVTGDLPPLVDNATRVVRIDQNAAVSFAQQSPIDGNQQHMPITRGTSFNAGVWVKNPGARTLNFTLQFFNISAASSVNWTGAVKARSGWVFVTFTPTQTTARTLQRGIELREHLEDAR